MLPCFSWLTQPALSEPRDYLPRGWLLPHELYPTEMPKSQPFGDISSDEVSSSQVTLVCVRLTKDASTNNHLLLLQRTPAWFPEPTPSAHICLLTPVPGPPMPLVASPGHRTHSETQMDMF